MSSKVAVEMQALCKSYRLYESPAHRMKELLFGGDRHSLFHALRDVELVITRGETVGVMGRNGAGKSTLLQLIAGTLTPSSGSISVHGRAAALLELGSGFDPEFTGRENVVLYASILGMTREEIGARMPQILKFADIGAFADQRLKTYSSGMIVRLAFATIAHLDPDILIVDEALAVGDVQFQMKCMQHVHALKAQGKTFLLASHSPDQIASFCTRAIVMEQGRTVFDGLPKDAIHIYKALLFPGAKLTMETAKRAEQPRKIVSVVPSTQLSKSEARYGTGEVKIVGMELLTRDGQPTNVVATNETVVLRLKIVANRNVEEPVYGIRVRNLRGLDVYVKNTLHQRISCPPLKPGREEIIEVPIIAALVGGEYFLGAGVAEYANGEQIVLDRRLDVVQLSIIGLDGSTGMANLNARFEIASLQERA